MCLPTLFRLLPLVAVFIEPQAAHELSPLILIKAEFIALMPNRSGVAQKIQFTRSDALVGAIAWPHKPVESAHDLFEYFGIR